MAGLLSGKIFIELIGKTRITSSTGYISEIEFIQKGWFYGDYFQIKGFIKDGLGVSYSLSGDWTKKTMFSKNGQAEEQLLFDSETQPHKRKFAPLDKQTELESHALWGTCTKAINEGDFGSASKLKTDIEEKQRAIRKQRKENGTVWSPRFFTFTVPMEHDLEGTTAQDPQHSGNYGAPANSSEQTKGHWYVKDDLEISF